ncbi:GNAT family N-acetyltransferase [Natronospora cellulosivora (SeqCode)]
MKLDIKIVEYSPEYADSLAEMWNLSNSNWGGGDTVYTEEDIKEEYENSSDINIYLALDDETVVGFCSFSEYEEDEGALYIPLLNVRPDYHGKKIGKALVLKTVERSIEMEWPRLDLYTWPGNTKAVPLYKKCGFFWEKRDDETHLMNFIPTVLNTEAVKEYFETIDWYNDSNRTIEIEADGSKEDDYGFYQYSWEKEEESLKMGFDRRGRGIRMIETNDYRIESKIQKQVLPFNNRYEIEYHLENKSSRNLEITLEGIDNKNIKYDFKKTLQVKDKEILKAKFYLGEIEKEQDHWRTHPVVETNISINGKKAVFKTGIEPKFPVNLNMNLKDSVNQRNIESLAYLELENAYEQAISLEFEIPVNDEVVFCDNIIKKELKAKEKVSIPINYIIKEYNLYSEDIHFKIKKDHEEVTFKRKLTTIFNGRGRRLSGESEKEWFITNGKYKLIFDKNDNEISFQKYHSDYYGAFILYPSIGLPFTTEFSQKKAEKVDFISRDNDAIKMEVLYRSEKTKGIDMQLIIELYSDGLIKYYMKLKNTQDKKSKEINTRYGIYFQLKNAVMPYADKIIELKTTEDMNLDNWNVDKLDENWILTDHYGDKYGLMWSGDLKVKHQEWHFGFEDNLGEIEAGSTIKTKPIYLALDTFRDWFELREFATRSKELNSNAELIKENNNPDYRTEESIAIEINQGNPIISDDFSLKINRYKKANIYGVIKVESDNNLIESYEKELSKEEEDRQIELQVKMNKVSEEEKKENSHQGIEVIDTELDLSSMVVKRKKLVFIKDNSISIDKKIEDIKGDKTYTFSNGTIQMKAAENYGPALYSLSYKGKEWLDSLYPKAGAKSWWNPWFGGISTHPGGLQNVSRAEAKQNFDFAELEDNKGNNWQGISIELDLEDNKDFRGLAYKQYYLTLPSLPLLLLTTEVIQNTGKHYNNKGFNTEVFVKATEDLKDSYFNHRRKDGEIIKYRAGYNDYHINIDKTVLFASENDKTYLQAFQSGYHSSWGFMNLDVLAVNIENYLSIKDGSKIFTAPAFLFFTDTFYQENILEDLKNIRFKCFT